MIVITKGQANTIILTLNEKKSLTSPYFLIRFINDVTREDNTCIASDTSSYTYRHNQFSITESNSENRTAGTLTLDPPGLWRYEVYEQSSSSNLDHTLATVTDPIEKGRCRVVGTAEISHTKYDSQPETFVVYER